MTSNALLGRRLWLFRATAVAGSLVIGGVLGWSVWQVRGLFGPSACDRAAASFEEAYASLPPAGRELLDAAGYGAADRLVLPANFDGCLVFSGKVMERHASRGYRFRPSQQNLWIYPPGFPYQVLVPDTESVRTLVERAGVSVSAVERVNSLGCRGPEWPEPGAFDFRVLVLGDSFVEGILVAEAQTLCSHLARELDQATGRPTLVANAGVIGYSTEQEFHTLVELAPVLQPHVALLCFYANDVHYDHHAVLNREKAAGDWDAAGRWLDACAAYCRRQSIRFMVAVIPDRTQLSARASRANYQHRLEAICPGLGIYLVDPYDRFLSHRDEPLWLESDAHLAPAGHALFAEVLAEHLRHWAAPARDATVERQ